MGENKGVNPLFIGLGVIAGAAGALFFSKPENRKKTVKAIKKATGSKQGLLEKTKSFLEDASKDLEGFTSQDTTVKPKRVVKKK